MQTIIQYFKEVRAEMAYVTWPSRNQTIFFTIGVLAVSILVAYYLGFLDYIFTRGLEWLLNR
jgi:preprotein translocase subunit SecE